MNLKSLTLLTLLGLTAVTANSFGETTQRDVKKGRFGAMEIIDHHEHGTKKSVLLPSKSYIRDYSQQAEFIREATEQVKINEKKIGDDKIYTCENREANPNPDGPGYFIPIRVG